ncbi:glycoside hydrolase family 3 N-terminal domain-containing protein [Bacteroides finegoldii]|uniref:glycoside hydrolase family 3 N-terminal domain-containing protein n=1 Tax=Bacteroides finegoldii TaxID=338188 RepID=UPI002673E8B8|nr:glycoside hydrolase family 3 N-terminal domain-containing protein [Bacteroides finegoldii]
MNKFIFITLFLVENVFSVCLAQSYPYQKESIPVPQRVKDLLSRMTLEEKIAELNLIPYYTKDDSICRSLIRAGKVGAFLKANGAELNRSLQEEALKHSRLGIPLVFHEDVIHGYRTITPIPLAESCSWNPELVEQSAAMAAREAAAAGIQLTYAPMVDISYDPRWGRIMETSGEDAYLCGELAAARVRGFQGNDLTSPHTIAACVKHFAGYGAVMAGRDYQETDVSLRKLQEIYLPPFQAAINAGAASVMCAYTSYDGEPLTMNYFMNEEVLRKQMQFKGLLMTDWTTFQHAVTEGAADNGQEAAERGIKSGIDMDMSAKQFIEFLPELVRTQKVPEQLINRAAARALELKFRLGLFDNPFAYFNTEREKQTLYSKESQEDAYQMACQSMVLLKNEDRTLPLSDSKRIALVGPFANTRYHLLGSWNMKGDSKEVITVEEGFKALRTDIPIDVRACDFSGITPAYLSDVCALAQKNEIIIACLGEPSNLSGEAVSTAKIELPDQQMRLLKALKTTGKKIIVVLFNGRPLVLDEVIKNCDALLEAWYPGTMGGKAVAALLTGIENPSGKLSQTFPRHAGQIPIVYNARRTFYTVHHADIPQGALFPFGFGLSYTQYKYSSPVTDKTEYRRGDSVTVRIKIKNTGSVAGREIVQLYIRDEVATVIPREKELKRFASIHLQPGEEKEIRFTIPSADFSIYNNKMEKVLEPGSFTIGIGPNSSELNQTKVYFL